MADWSTPEGVEITGAHEPDFEQILTVEALDFIAALHREHNARRLELLEARQRIQARLDDGEDPDFLEETAEIRAGDWQVASIPEPLQRRTVEITGPVDRKMVINALNSGADVFMADFEDSNSPTWTNTIAGQLNLRDAIRGTITYEHPPRAPTSWATRSPRCWCARAAGTSSKSTSWSTVSRPAPRSSTSGSTSSTTPRPCSSRARALLLPAQAGELPGGAAVERRLRPGSGGPGPPAGTIKATV